MNKNPFTYKKSGVDIDAADKFVKFISFISTKKRGKKKFSNIGGFGAISNIPNNIKKPKIVACTDGVGTKIEIANLIKKYDTIGIDLVAMSVNDLIVQGAKPILFLDYISINKIDLVKLKSILKGIVKGCKISNCELVGGETAEMPGTYEKGKFDIAGFAVGVVDKNKILNKEKIKKNDLILAIPSNGVHSNGFFWEIMDDPLNLSDIAVFQLRSWNSSKISLMYPKFVTVYSAILLLVFFLFKKSYL